MAGVINNPPPPGQLTKSDGQVSDAFYRWLLSLPTDLTNAQNTTDSAIAALQNETINDFIPGFIEFPTNKDYPLSRNLLFPITTIGAFVTCTSGSCYVTFKRNGTTLWVMAVTTARNSFNTSPAFSAGDDIIMTVTGNSNCRNMSFAFYYSRPLFT